MDLKIGDYCVINSVTLLPHGPSYKSALVKIIHKSKNSKNLKSDKIEKKYYVKTILGSNIEIFNENDIRDGGVSNDKYEIIKYCFAGVP